MKNDSKKIFQLTKKKFKELGEHLENQKFINKYIVDDKDGVVLQLFRKPDNKEFFIRLDQGGEMMYSCFDGSYIRVTSEYDENGKESMLNDFLDTAKSMMVDRNYYEEIYEQNGKVIYRKLVYPSGYSVSSAKKWGWGIRKFFGVKKKILHPPKI